MENKTNKSGKTEKILKGVAYVGAAAAGSLGTMAFTSPGKSESDIDATPDETDGIVIETDNDNDMIVAQLTDEQVEDLKEGLRMELREEIRQELLHADNFIQEVKEEIMASVDPHQVTPSNNHPEIEVLDYNTGSLADGSTYDIAKLRVNGTLAEVIDVDQDGYADLCRMETNGNSIIDSGDYIGDVSCQGVSMTELCEAAHQRDEELLAGNGDYVENTDHIDFLNTADTSDFTA